METGEILKNLRLDAGYTQSALAKLLDIGQSTIVGYEKLEREPTITNLVRYANFFNVSIDFLVGLEDNFGVKATYTSAPTNDHYTAEERQLIEKYRGLNSHCKKLINNTIDTLVTTSSATTKQKKKG